MELSINEKRARILKAYRGASWAEKVSKMSDAQINAIYIRFINEKKI